MKISGLASVFFDPRDPAGTQFWLSDSMIERIAPEAFDGESDKENVWSGFNHDPNSPLGRVGAGTLKITRDPKGLRYTVDLPASPVGLTVGAAIRRGDVRGSSFAFVVLKQNFSQATVDGKPVLIRTIEKVSLVEVGPVTQPAYESTTAEPVSA